MPATISVILLLVIVGMCYMGCLISSERRNR